MPDIGETLREARMRARIDVSEIEAKTKIRAKYLRALENEEWGLLPGPTFVKSFLRTYAQALGLDGKALVEEYRATNERPSEAALEPIVSTPQRSRQRGAPARSGGGPSLGYMALVGVIGLLIVLLIIGLATRGGGGRTHSSAARSVSGGSAPSAGRKSAHGGGAPASAPGARSQSAIVSLSMRASATVYVCLEADGGRKLIAGQTLSSGSHTPTYRARRFELTLGNNAVTLYIDGIARSVPASSQPIGYAITKALGRKPLPVGQQPTCK